MVEAANKCDAEKDSVTFIECSKSGELHPDDVLFEEYGKPPPTAANKTKTAKAGGLFGAGKKKDSAMVNEAGIANDYADLPPAQRKIKFNKAIATLQEQLNQTEKQKDGLVKMKETSEKFGGDLSSIQSQIDELERELERVKPILMQFQCYLAAAIDSEVTRKTSSRPSSTISPTPAPGGDAPPAPPPPPATGGGDNTGNDDAVDLPPPPPPLPTQQSGEFVDEFDDDDVTTVHVLYDFSGNNEGELTVSFGEELTLVEEDDSGWSRVARGDDEGYIPSSYINKM